MTRPWYVDGFGAHYLDLYARRNQGEADESLDLLAGAGVVLEDSVLLDLCCGGGRYLRALSVRGARVIGLDLSPELLREARGRIGSGQSLLRGDMRRLPFSADAFDGVLSMFSSFGYFQTDSENWQVFGEIARVLKPGGFFLFDFLNSRHVELKLVAESERRASGLVACESRRIESGRVLKRVRLLDAATGEERLSYEESVRLFTPAEIRAALSDAGFSEEQAWGDYGGGGFDQEYSPRLLLLLRLDEKVGGGS